MKKTKLEKGITLIALIITIVVLLILAVVTIGAVKDSGIIGHAKNASSKYTIAQEKEKINVALGEWQIEKNIPTKTATFKDVMEIALSGKAKVEGGDNGPLTITINGTGNQYTVTKEGKITEGGEVNNEEDNLLAKYIFGADLAGRPMTDIINMETFSFIDDTTTEGIDETQTIGAKFITIAPESAELGSIYFESQGITYKFGINSSSYLTDKNYGIVKIYDSEAGTRVGKTVKYDNKIWTIIYDDSTNGLQMISNESMLYNGSALKLSYTDSSITDWSKVTGVEFDGIDGLSNFEKAVYSYNHAIDTLNTTCESLVTPNNNIIDVRCIGSNPTDKSAENKTLYKSDNLAKWPINNETYAAGIGNERGKSTDYNYVSDFDIMIVLGINIEANRSVQMDGYWLASRIVKVDSSSNNVEFCMFFVNNSGYRVSVELWNVYESGASYSSENTCTLRPVVSLRTDTQLIECITGEADYILE